MLKKFMSPQRRERPQRVNDHGAGAHPPQTPPVSVTTPGLTGVGCNADLCSRLRPSVSRIAAACVAACGCARAGLVFTEANKPVHLGFLDQACVNGSASALPVLRDGAEAMHAVPTAGSWALVSRDGEVSPVSSVASGRVGSLATSLCAGGTVQITAGGGERSGRGARVGAEGWQSCVAVEDQGLNAQCTPIQEPGCGVANSGCARRRHKLAFGELYLPKKEGEPRPPPSAAPPGHRQRFGEQGQPRQPIAQEVGCLGSRTFLANYVHMHRPVKMAGCGRELAASSLWTDDYLAATAGDWDGWPLPRSDGLMGSWPRGNFSTFIHLYRSHKLPYIPNDSIPPTLRRDVTRASHLHCGGIGLRGLTLWFTAAWQQSKLHYDTEDATLTQAARWEWWER